MLAHFCVSNFKNFSKELKFDLSSGRYAFNDFNVENRVVKTAVVYGYNTSGKSNLALAVFDIVRMLTDNEFSVSRYGNYKNILRLDELTSFSYTFLFGKDEVVYSYEKDGLDKPIAERLFINGRKKLSFDRRVGNEMQQSFEGAQTLERRIDNPNLSAVRYLRMNSSLPMENEDNAILLKFYGFVDRMLLFWCLQERNYIGFTSKVDNLIDYIVNTEHLDAYNCFLREMGIDRRVVAKKTPDGRIVAYYDFGNGRLLEYVPNMSNGESSLLLFYYWYLQMDSTRTPSLLFIDEFDAFYHIELSKRLVELLSHKKDIQVVLTTHNPHLMSNEILRPDSYFVLSDNYIASIDKLTEKEIRQAHNLERLYIAGAFDGK